MTTTSTPVLEMRALESKYGTINTCCVASRLSIVKKALRSVIWAVFDVGLVSGALFKCVASLRELLEPSKLYNCMV